MTEQQKTYMAMQNPGVRDEWERLRDSAPEMLELLWVVQKDLEDDGRWPRWRDGLEALLARFPR